LWDQPPHQRIERTLVDRHQFAVHHRAKAMPGDAFRSRASRLRHLRAARICRFRELGLYEAGSENGAGHAPVPAFVVTAWPHRASLVACAIGKAVRREFGVVEKRKPEIGLFLKSDSGNRDLNP